MDFSQVFKNTFSKAFSANGFKLSLLTWFLVGILQLAVFSTGFSSQPDTLGLVSLLVAVPIVIVATMVIWVAAIRSFHEERFDWEHFQTNMASTAFKTFLVYLLAGTAAYLGLFLLLIPGLIAYTAFYIALPVLILEDTGIIESLKKSWSRTNGSRLAIFGLAALLYILTTFVLAPFQVIAVLVGSFGNPGAFAGVIFFASYFGVYAQLLTTAATVSVYEDISASQDEG
jgi:hypothetical protein